MTFPTLRQSTLDRSRSIMGLWILTLTVTLGIVMGEKSCITEVTPTQNGRVRLVDRTVLSITTRLSKPVFALKSPARWMETKSDWSRANSPTTWNDLARKRPFERTTEPDFCQLNPHPSTADLSIKLTRHYASTRVQPVHFLNLLAEFPFEQALQSTKERQEPNFHGAFISGAAYLR